MVITDMKMARNGRFGFALRLSGSCWWGWSYARGA